jgi:hypothetical protein
MNCGKQESEADICCRNYQLNDDRHPDAVFREFDEPYAAPHAALTRRRQSGWMKSRSWSHFPQRRRERHREKEGNDGRGKLALVVRTHHHRSGFPMLTV